MDAIEDAQRLATKVKHQQQQLNVYEQRIANLETRLRWYRVALDLQANDSVPTGEGEPLSTDPPDIEPQGKPATPPAGDIEHEKEPLPALDDTEPAEQTPGSPKSVQEEEKSPEYTRRSRIGRWLWQRLS